MGQDVGEVLRLLLIDAGEFGVRARVGGGVVSIVLPLRNTEFNASNTGWWVVHRLGGGREVVVEYRPGLGPVITFTGPGGAEEYDFENASVSLDYHDLLIRVSIILGDNTIVGRYALPPGVD